MRLPSLGEVVNVAQHSARRFPLVLVAGAVAASAGIALIGNDGEQPALIRLLVVGSLGLPLMFALTVMSERRASTASTHWLTLGAGVAVLAGFWLLWPGWTTAGRGIRYAQLSVAFHLFVAFAPFIGRAEPNAFWQYNKGLFLRFLIAAIYTGVLWLGVSGALLALDKLFGVPIPGEGYVRLWILFSFVFNPWFFVSGVPQYLGALEEQHDYPRGLRVFTQYVLVPIVAIYLIIITVYFGKVAITREWPNGWIGYMVSSVAGVGILSWLLVHPLEERAEHAWVKTFTRGFYVALMPAVVMLWLAIGKRVAQYGITERRYFLIVLSAWLGATAVYYTLSRSRSIKLIPATLCALALITFAGPWSAYAVSERSQKDRLVDVLTRNDLFADGTLRAATRTVSDADRKEISAGVRYLLETHGAASVTPWLGDSIARTVGAVGAGNSSRADAGARSIVTAMNVQYSSRWEETASDYFSYYTERSPSAVKIEGYSYAIRLSPGMLHDSLLVSDGVYVRATSDPVMLMVTRGGARLIEVPLQPVIDSVAAYRKRHPVGPIPPDMMTVEVQAGRGGALVRLTQIAGTTATAPRTDRRPPGINSLEGDFYIRIP